VGKPVECLDRINFLMLIASEVNCTPKQKVFLSVSRLSCECIIFIFCCPFYYAGMTYPTIDGPNILLPCKHKKIDIREFSER
jgi:hypothetical protein